MRKSQLLHLTKHVEGKQATRNCDVFLNCETSDNDSCYPTLQKLQEDIRVQAGNYMLMVTKSLAL